jgi:hypothetical protein
MKLEQRLTASQLASLALGMGFLAFLVITFLALTPNLRLVSQSDHTFWIWVICLCFFLGAVAVISMYMALEAFRRGVDESLWNKDSLERLKTQLGNPRWTVPLFIMALGIFGYILWHLRPSQPDHSGFGGFAYFWMSPLLALGRLRQTLRPKPEGGRPGWLDGMKPVISEHWGER